MRAFTILEVMLVLVVLASILLYAAITIRGRTEDKLLDLTAMQVQQILQAANNFYIYQQSQQLFLNTRYMYRNPGANLTGNFWPTSLAQLASFMTYSQSTAGSSADNNGLPICTEWPLSAPGLNVCTNGKQGYQIISPNAPKTNVPVGSSNTNKNTPTPNTGYFGISLTLPTQALAEKLAARLPFSVTLAYSSQAYTVNTYIPAPGIFYNPVQFKNRGWITSAGVLTGSSSTSQLLSPDELKIYMPNCPQGYEGHYILTYMKQRTGHCYQNQVAKVNLPAVEHTDIELGYLHGHINGSGNNVNVTSNLGNHEDTTGTGSSPLSNACGVSGGLSGLAGLRDLGFKGLYYITFCIPNGQWQFQTGYCSGDDYFEAEGGQCTTNWHSYNPGGTCPSTN